MRLPINVVEDELCVRCGACLDICPTNLIQSDNEFYPTMSGKNKQECNRCGLCMRACPSCVDFKAIYLKIFGQIPYSHDVVGILKNIYVGYATNVNIRRMGSSGGMVTALLIYLLEQGIIEQALVCGINKKDPLKPRVYLARSIDDIIASAQSKYVVVPQMRLLGEIIRSDTKTAIVGLPCHIHAFRKMELWQKKRTENVKLIIGLACNRTLEMNAVPELLELKKIDQSMVKAFEYRGGNTWPGSVRVQLKNGEKINLAHNVKDAFNILKTFYTPKRCLSCIDFSAELADISVMDPWIRDEAGEYLYPQHYSMAFIRNVRAGNLINGAKEEGYLVLEDLFKNNKITLSEMIERSQFKYSQNLKKRVAPARIDRYKKAGKPYPEYKVDFHSPSTKEDLSERYDSLLMLPGNWKWFRSICLRFSFSKIGIRLMVLRNLQKKGKIIKQYKNRNNRKQ